MHEYGAGEEEESESEDDEKDDLIMLDDDKNLDNDFLERQNSFGNN